MVIEFGNTRRVECGLCGRLNRETELCECVMAFLRGPHRVPSNDERAAYFNRAGTSVAQEVGRITLGRWVFACAATIRALASEGLGWVWRKVRR